MLQLIRNDLRCSAMGWSFISEFQMKNLGEDPSRLSLQKKTHLTLQQYGSVHSKQRAELLFFFNLHLYGEMYFHNFVVSISFELIYD